MIFWWKAAWKPGSRFDVIGLQSHMHQGYWGVEKTLKILEHFSRFNYPCISPKPHWFPVI